jgi:hypothetical protein
VELGLHSLHLALASSFFGSIASLFFAARAKAAVQSFSLDKHLAHEKLLGLSPASAFALRSARS